MARKKKAVVLSIPDQLEEVSRMKNEELEYVINEDDERPGIVRQFAEAILDGQISDTLKIIKEVSKMKAPEDAKKTTSVEELAIGDDDEAFYEALIQQNVSQLERPNVSPQEVARLSQNINIFRKELRDIRSRRPKAGSVLEKVLNAADNKSKPATKPKTAPKTAKKVKTTPVKDTKKKTTASKAAGATKKKKTDIVPSGAKK